MLRESAQQAGCHLLLNVVTVLGHLASSQATFRIVAKETCTPQRLFQPKPGSDSHHPNGFQLPHQEERPGFTTGPKPASASSHEGSVHIPPQGLCVPAAACSLAQEMNHEMLEMMRLAMHNRAHLAKLHTPGQPMQDLLSLRRDVVCCKQLGNSIFLLEAWKSTRSLGEVKQAAHTSS